MEKKLFRDKSMEQITSPDRLTDYLRVTGPGVWLVLIGIILLLGGLLVWGVFGKIITTVTVPSIVEDRMIHCYIKVDDINLKDPEVRLEIGDVVMYADGKHFNRKTMEASDDPILYSSGYLQQGQTVIVLHGDCYLDDGYYDTVVTTETLHPISFLFDK